MTWRVHSAVVLATGFLVCASALPAKATTYADPTKANVLRQYGVTGPNLVTQANTSAGGASLQATGGNEGSGIPDQWQLSSTGAGSGTATFTLPGPRTVGSYKTSWNGSYPSSGGWLLEGFSGGSWVSLATTPSTPTAGTFTPTTVTALRYTATGPGGKVPGSYYLQNEEMEVFQDASQTVDYADGYNILRDSGRISTLTDSTTSNNWKLRTSSLGASATVDGDYFTGHVHSQNTTAADTTPTTTTQRSFMTYSFSSPTQLKQGNLGWYNGQTWSAWELYSSDATTIPATQSLTTADPANIEAAGWNLEASGSGATSATVSGSYHFNFANSTGDTHRHLMLVWNGSGAMVEFEAYASAPVPEPASLGLVAMGSLLLLRRRKAGK